MEAAILASANSKFSSISALSKLTPPPILSSPSSSSARIYAVRTDEKIQVQQQQQPKEVATKTSSLPTTVHPKTNNTRIQNSNTSKPTNTVIKSTPPPRVISPSLPAFLCNTLDNIINNFIDPPVLRPTVDPRHVLVDNFAPVDEMAPTPCQIIHGSVPSCLAGGTYIRNGPNPQHLPRGPHHLFDGDGMMHSILMPSGETQSAPLYSSRYVHTYKYRIERDAGAAVLPSTFAAFHGVAGMARGAVTAARILTGQLNPIEGIGLANTSLAFFSRRLFALGESDLPYELYVSPENGDVTTVGRSDFDGKLFMGMTAHPKLDKSTGELFAFRYGPVPPFLTYFRFDADGQKAGPDVPIFSLRGPSFLHDFAITSKYAVFVDIQIVMKPMDMVIGGGAPVGSDAAKISRIGVLPRYAESETEIRWFDIPGFNPVHIVNAWDEGDEMVVIAPNIFPIEHALERMELVHSCMEMVRIDLRKGGEITRTPLSADNIDFGVVHPRYLGRKSRYAYLGIGNPMPKISGVVKLDLELAGKGDCVVARREFGNGRFGGEPFYVCKGESEDEAEDDGYLVSYVHDEVSGESRFIVMDARSPDLEVVFEAALPRRVPYGFHGIFVTEAEINKQRRQ